MAVRDSFLGQTIKRVGYRHALDVGEFFMAWLTVHHELGQRPSVEEYAAWWKVSRATAYREQQKFREAWPEFDTPSDVASVLGLDPVSGSIPALFQMRAPRTT